ncbi:helix-turn-helix domain-containing protein [Klebsiella sp. BIGb0407]|uniref:MarR family transcriptional regulator n=1 Tax=Klebsiella sp. BIGb0407 TaxID=2940603 RepID=UPI002169573C|nr:helix-turn-helix domain-containing protein [Klebsiella sp. BIGb0407]MCS3433680.1 hypothetical protein [Klebsiella sp. BIGb0407]
MRTPAQKLILNYIIQNPDTQMSDIIAALPELSRSAISSTLPILVREGRLIRTAGCNKRFEYRIVHGQVIRPLPEEVETKTANLLELPLNREAISIDEWQRRFEQVKELQAKGLFRRASRLSLELLDVTGDVRLREELIIFKAGTNRVGIWL